MSEATETFDIAELQKDQNRRIVIDNSKRPQRYIGQSFDTFEAKTEAHSRLLAFAKTYAAHLAAGETRNGLLVFGEVGTGKTYLAACIADFLARELRSHLWIDEAAWIRELQLAISDKERSQAAIYDNAARSKILIIDDLGKARQGATGFAADEVAALLDYRHQHMLPTIITTNRSPGQRPYTDDNCDLGQLLSPRAFSRLHEAFDFCGPFPGKDRRKSK